MSSRHACSSPACLACACGRSYAFGLGARGLRAQGLWRHSRALRMRSLARAPQIEEEGERYVLLAAENETPRKIARESSYPSH